MARLVLNPPKPVIRIKVSPRNFKALLAYASSVHDHMFANVAVFLSPSPTLANFAIDIGALASSIATLGTKTNKGGSSALASVKFRATAVYTDMIALANYVTNFVTVANTSPVQAANTIALSGFATKSPKSKIDTLQFVRSAKLVNSKKFPFTTGTITWRKCLGLFKGVKISGYNIYVNGTFSGSTTKTNYVLPPVTAAAIQQVSIRPFNARGEGNAFLFSVSQLATP